jgi:hypothetical protein
MTLLVAVTGCGRWETSYHAKINPVVTPYFDVTRISVDVPYSLSTSEERIPAPDADIVWQEPFSGDRHKQVAAIFTEAAEIGTASLNGPRKVELKIEVKRFHALTEFARVWAYNAGVHHIIFTAQFVDARTGEALFDPILVQSDLVAYSGETSERAQKVGETQQVRITRHLAQTIDGWVGTGPDNRGHFWRFGF